MPEDWADICEFYQRTSYSATVDPSERLFIAETEDGIVGAVRLCSEGGVQVLRGMRVLEEMRRQHIGISLLRMVEEHMEGSPCYCIPHAYLEPLYSRVGFRTLECEAAPVFLRDRLREYGARGLNVIIMKREGGTERNRHRNGAAT